MQTATVGDRSGSPDNAAPNCLMDRERWTIIECHDFSSGDAKRKGIDCPCVYCFVDFDRGIMRSLRIPLQIVFYKDEEDWVAHCLEFDVCGDGQTRENAMKSLSAAIAIQVEDSIQHNNPRNLFSPADPKFFQMFAAGEDIAVEQLSLQFKSITIGQTQTREYRETQYDKSESGELAPA